MSNDVTMTCCRSTSRDMVSDADSSACYIVVFPVHCCSSYWTQIHEKYTTFEPENCTSPLQFYLGSFVSIHVSRGKFLYLLRQIHVDSPGKHDIRGGIQCFAGGRGCKY